MFISCSVCGRTRKANSGDAKDVSWPCIAVPNAKNSIGTPRTGLSARLPGHGERVWSYISHRVYFLIVYPGGEPETISKSDFKFLAEVLKTDVAKIGPIPRGHVIKVDYKAVAITSGPSDDNRPNARETDEAGQERWDTLVKRAELSDGHYRVVVVYFPRGEMVVRRVTSLHVESDDDGVWEWEPGSMDDSDDVDIDIVEDFENQLQVTIATKEV